jgi:Uma2 family endonuclease
VIIADAIAQRRFTAAEFTRMCQAGVFGPDETVELVDGKIFVMPPQGPLRAATARLLLERILAEGFTFREILHENPVLLGGDSACVPDLVLVEPDPEDPLFRRRHPTQEQIRLIVEISDSTLAFDRQAKATTYAAAGIREYWVVDLNGRRLVVHTHPVQGKYDGVTELTWGDGQRVALPGGKSLDVDALFAE